MSGLDEAAVHAAREQYHRDGAAVLRGVLPPERLEQLGGAVDQLMSSGRGQDLAEQGRGRFFGDLFSWLVNTEFQDFLFNGVLPELAGKFMQSEEVRFFYDQLLVKEPGTAKRTPWHQDLPYWPASGEDVLSIWVPIDAASPENGVVTYVKGSHRAHHFIPVQDWTAAEENGVAPILAGGDWAQQSRTQPRILSEIRDHPERFEFLSWEVEPGDVILHHPLVIHGAPGNLSSSRRRRALATRWFGDDARWDDSRPHFMRHFSERVDFPYPTLAQGGRMADPLFPVVWTRAKGTQPVECVPGTLQPAA